MVAEAEAEAKGEGDGGRPVPRRDLESLVRAAELIFESGLIPEAKTAGHLVAWFLRYEARGKPIGQALIDVEARRKRQRQDDEGRAEAREEEAHGRSATDHPFHFPNRERTPLVLDIPTAAGKDRRLWLEVVEQETARVAGMIRAEVDKHSLREIDTVATYRTTNAVVTELLKRGVDPTLFLQVDAQGEVKVDGRGEPRRRELSKLTSVLMKLYRGEWREPLREILAEYFERKLREGMREVERQVYGDAPFDPEDDTQELPSSAEDESQEAPALAGVGAEDDGKGDAYLPPE